MLDQVLAGVPAGGIAGQEISGHRKNDPAKLVEAAKQFEALLLGEMLKSMREASGAGWLGAEEDAAGDSAIALAQEQFAQALAQNGGLGLSKLVADGLLLPRDR
jgi:Rod binding domain-containing protein